MAAKSTTTIANSSVDPYTPKAITDIDRRTCHRTVPMKVLVLGLSRTGTNSIRMALEMLGYDATYHGYDAVFQNPRDCEMWLDGMRAKFEGKGKLFGKEEFDQLLGHCQAVTDAPAVCFAPELIKAYPEAKVILTNRDVDEWHASVMRSIISQVFTRTSVILSYIAWIMRSTGRWSRPVFVLVWNGYFRHFPTNGKEVFHEHYATVRRLVPKERLLEYQVAEGWGPLCDFLGCEVPSQPFPRSNETEATVKLIKQLMEFERKKMIRTLGPVVAVVVAVLALWYFR